MLACGCLPPAVSAYVFAMQACCCHLSLLHHTLLILPGPGDCVSSNARQAPTARITTRHYLTTAVSVVLPTSREQPSGMQKTTAFTFEEKEKTNENCYLKDNTHDEGACTSKGCTSGTTGGGPGPAPANRNKTVATRACLPPHDKYVTQLYGGRKTPLSNQESAVTSRCGSRHTVCGMRYASYQGWPDNRPI